MHSVDIYLLHCHVSAVVAAEAGKPHSVSLRASGHAAEVASAGGSRRGRLPDRSGGQRPAGWPDRGRHEGLAQDLKEDGREVGHLIHPKNFQLIWKCKWSLMIKTNVRLCFHLSDQVLFPSSESGRTSLCSERGRWTTTWTETLGKSQKSLFERFLMISR